MLAKAMYQSINVLADRPHSRASRIVAPPLPQGNVASHSGSAVALAFDLRRPVKPRWPQAGIAQWAPRQDAGVAATRPWMADRGGPTEQCLTAGMPSLGEAPSGGARALWLLWGFSKVTRRKGGTHSRRYRSNGYVPNPTPTPTPTPTPVELHLEALYIQEYWHLVLR